jgi:Zn(2)-Cys(6) binuclear cluster domain-containing protein
MPSPESSASPDESFFNDLSQQPKPTPTRRSTDDARPSDAQCDNESQPRAKRIACVLCRKRKLRCDGARPKCGTCSRLSHECGYDEVRKKSGPKRGYVKLLEQRLRRLLETHLKGRSNDSLL